MLEYRSLGATGLVVSRLCLGTLTMGPLQANLPLKKGVGILERAWELGVNFVDTAELYGTYPYVREAIREIGRESLIIAARSYASTYEEMRESFRKACVELGTDRIEIFLLHEQESLLTIRGHRGAIEFLCDAKRHGDLIACGISTHYVGAVHAAAQMDEIDVIHPLYNLKGTGIMDGGVHEMTSAIRKAFACGKGIYSMKALAGGHFIREIRDAFRFVLGSPFVSSIAVGVKNLQELEIDIRLFEGYDVPESSLRQARSGKILLIQPWCTGCGRCVERCPERALRIDGGRAVVARERCLLCGYCAGVCREGCIKVV